MSFVSSFALKIQGYYSCNRLPQKPAAMLHEKQKLPIFIAKPANLF